MCVYMYVCVCMHVYLCVYVCVSLCVSVCVYLCVYLCVCVSVCVYLCVCTFKLEAVESALYGCSASWVGDDHGLVLRRELVEHQLQLTAPLRQRARRHAGGRGLERLYGVQIHI